MRYTVYGGIQSRLPKRKAERFVALATKIFFPYSLRAF